MIEPCVFELTRSAVDNQKPNFITRYAASLGRFVSGEFGR